MAFLESNGSGDGSPLFKLSPYGIEGIDDRLQDLACTAAHRVHLGPSGPKRLKRTARDFVRSQAPGEQVRVGTAEVVA
jgi:hypothetical protein